MRPVNDDVKIANLQTYRHINLKRTNSKIPQSAHFHISTLSLWRISDPEVSGEPMTLSLQSRTCGTGQLNQPCKELFKWRISDPEVSGEPRLTDVSRAGMTLVINILFKNHFKTHQRSLFKWRISDPEVSGER